MKTPKNAATLFESVNNDLHAIYMLGYDCGYQAALDELKVRLVTGLNVAVKATKPKRKTKR